MVRTALSQATTQTTRDIEGGHLVGSSSIPCRVTRQPLTQGEEEFHIYTLAFKVTEAEWNRIQRALEPLARLEMKDLPGV
jgi:hypothetical protein